MTYSKQKKDFSNYKEVPPLELTSENFNIALRVYHDEIVNSTWFKPEEIDRYFSVLFLRLDLIAPKTINKTSYSSREFNLEFIPVKTCSQDQFGEKY